MHNLLDGSDVIDNFLAGFSKRCRMLPELGRQLTIASASTCNVCTDNGIGFMSDCGPRWSGYLLAYTDDRFLHPNSLFRTQEWKKT